MSLQPIKDVFGKYTGSVFLDNLTLSGGIRALGLDSSTSLNDQYRRFDENDPSRLRGGKWNYELNNAFRFAIDIYSLAQVIEAIVLFDKILVDEKKYTAAEHLNALVIPVHLHPIERLVLMNSSVDMLKKELESDLAHHFLALLSQTSTESVFLHMSHGYFMTGYSDQVLFPDITKSFSLGHLINEALERDSSHIEADELSQELMLINKLYTSFDKSLKALLQDQYHQERMVLRTTEYHRGDLHEKMIASQDILRNAFATYFYENLAASCGLAYLPHLMRSYFLLFNQTLKQRGVGSTAYGIMQSLQEFRKVKVRNLNSFYLGTMIDVSLPLMLSLVLEKSSKPSDILPIAQELRDSKEAREFRSWVSDIDLRLATGRIDLNTLSKEIKKVQRVADLWMSENSTSGQEMASWNIIFSKRISKLSHAMQVPSKWQLHPQPRHLIFLQRLAQVSNHTPRLDVHLQRVFGTELATYWRQYHHCVDTFALPPTEPEGKCLSPLSKQGPGFAWRGSMNKPIDILFLAANPKGTIPLRLDEEIREIDMVLQQAEFRNGFTLQQHFAVRVSDLQGYLLRHKPTIVHFSGHGASTSEILLEDMNGNSHYVTATALSQLFSILKDQIRCVVLNACYSEQQAHAIAQHIDCVIGMSNTIGDSAAIKFATAFYQALGYGMSVKTAFELGRVQIDLLNLEEQHTPKLLALRKDPKDMIFVRYDD